MRDAKRAGSLSSWVFGRWSVDGRVKMQKILAFPVITSGPTLSWPPGDIDEAIIRTGGRVCSVPFPLSARCFGELDT